MGGFLKAEKRRNFFKNSLTILPFQYIMAKLSSKLAAIAQPVERILGKDEVASSNLASSSKTLENLVFSRVFLFLSKKSDRIPTCHFLMKG